MHATPHAVPPSTAPLISLARNELALRRAGVAVRTGTYGDVVVTVTDLSRPASAPRPIEVRLNVQLLDALVAELLDARDEVTR